MSRIATLALIIASANSIAAAQAPSPPPRNSDPSRGHPAVMSRPNDWGRRDVYAPDTALLPLPLQATVSDGSPQLRWLGQYICPFLHLGYELRVTNHWDRQTYEFLSAGRARYGFETYQRRRDRPLELQLIFIEKDGRYVRGEEAASVLRLLESHDSGRPAANTCAQS